MAVTIKSATTIKGNTTVGFSPASLFAAGEQGVWYDPSDFSTMFQDTAGATPVTAVEQPVGLLLDKRNTNFSTAFNGTNALLSVAANSAFTFGTGAFTVEAWIYLTAYATGATTICSNTLPGGSNNAFNFSIATASRKLQIATWNVVLAISTNQISLNTWTHVAASFDGTTYRVFINGALEGSGTTTYNLSAVNDFNVGYSGDGSNPYRFTGNINNLRVVKGSAVYTAAFTPPGAPLSPISGTSILTCGTSWSGNPTITNTNTTSAFVSPFGTGNHATQSTAGNRPVLSARVNLLTKTEQFDDAFWSKYEASVTANSVVAPDGSLTADKIVDTTLLGNHSIYKNTTFVNGVSYKLSVYAKAAEYNWFTLDNVNSTVDRRTYFNLSNGTVGTTDASHSNVSILPVGNGWYYCTITFTASSTSLVAYELANANNGASFSGTGSSGIYLWGADLRVSNDGVGLPVYQRVNTSTDYDTTGFPYYLAFDGNDVLATASINFSATDKMSVYSGMRRLANGGIPIELSALSASNSGTFHLYAGDYASATGAYWTAGSKGNIAWNANQEAQSAASYNAPLSNVLAHTHDISGDSTILRANGSQIATATGDQGTGNFGNFPLNVGARNNGSGAFYTGRIYSLIVRGAASTSDQITATENWVNTKTKAY